MNYLTKMIQMTNPNRSRAFRPAINPAARKETRGGKRAGAGAPTHSESGGKIMRSYRLAPDVIAILDSNRPAAQLIENAVRAYAKQLEQTAENS